MILEKRGLNKIAILTVITLGIYFIYWTVKTKNSFKALGANIPTTFLIIIPGANLYFWYKYSFGFSKFVRKSDEYVGYFVLTSLMPFISMFVIQNELNNL